MSGYRCQICGRRKSLRKNGMVTCHYVGGAPCPGSGFPPIEHDDGCLLQRAAKAESDVQRAYDAVRRLEDARASWIDPALLIRRAALASHAVKLERRLKRHLDWPARYRRSIARQMERQGYAWAEPPPLYLVEREGRQFGAMIGNQGVSTIAIFSKIAIMPILRRMRWPAPLNPSR